MKLMEALEIVQAPQPEETRSFRVSLVCGFNALHFQTFLNAELRRRRTDRKPKINSGLYGDFWGNLVRASALERDAAVVLLEWPDLDPRLGFRNLGGWSPVMLPEIVETARRRIRLLESTIPGFAKGSPIVISLPTLPMPPVNYTPGWQASSIELDLKACLAIFAAGLTQLEGISVLRQQRLDEVSAFGERADLRSELMTGFPYGMKHASTLAELISRLLAGAARKKGLITDLDNTLWRGILGDVGPEGVSWDMDHHSQIHGVYQQFLHSLSEAGVLIAVASKNDPALVAEAFRRKDIHLPLESIFPFEVHWAAKSESVTRILKAWNIAQDAVVFIDDSPAELAEVQFAHPQVECMAFPSEDPQKIFSLMEQLRDQFGTDSLNAEDRIRSESLRKSYVRAEDEASRDGSPESFLREVGAELSINFSKHPFDPRAFELINKTNQFNLNGRRLTEAEWKEHILLPDVYLLVCSYADKYGPLGKIAVLAGRKRGHVLSVDIWVMSCRAFGRRIEYACLDILYENFGVNEIEFDYLGTDRNGPMESFLEDILGVRPAPGSVLSRESFFERRLETFHTVKELSHG